MKPGFYFSRVLRTTPLLLLLITLFSQQINAQTTWQIGMGTGYNDQYTYPTPYGNWYSGMRTQFLYTATEMIAAGMTPGTIDQIAFNLIATNNAQPLQSYNISIKGTTTGNTNTWQTTGFTLVYTNASLSPTLGWNTYNLSTPFTWNGTDNILIDICFWNGANNYTYNGGVQWTTNAVPGTNTSIWYRSDSGGPFCATTNTTGTSTNRPNIKFTRLLGPPANMMANPSPTCSGDQVTLSADGFSNGATANWSGPGIPPNTTTPSAGGAASYTFTAPSVATTTTYTYTVTQTVGATTSPADSTQLTVNPLPVFTNNSPSSNTPVCEGATIAFNVSTNPGGAAYSWTGPGFGAPATTASPTIPNAQPGDAGTYTVTVTSGAGCSVTGNTSVVVNPKPTATLAPLNPVCSADPPVTLSGGSPAGGNYYGTGVSNGMFDPMYGTQTINYAYADANGCRDTASQVQTVNPSPSVLLAELPEICSNGAPLTLYGGYPQGGVFSGPNVNNGVFTQTGAGTYNITYSYSDSTGCTGSITLPLTVKSAGNTALAGSTGNTESEFIVDIPATTEVRYTPDCDLIAVIDPSAPSPISGNTTVSVILDENVNTYGNRPYVQRHYSITSVTNTVSGTGTLTLYAYQSEFNAYNAVASSMGLPLLPTGVDNGNVRITSFRGVSTVPDPLAPTETVTPTMTWDAAHSWWVMTFPVTQIGGFYIHTGDMTLDVANIGVSAAGDMAVYPNPASDKITVSLSGTRSANSLLSVTDLTGRVLIHVPMDNDKAIIDMSSLAAGIYLVNYSDDNRKQTVKITKQ